jgi:hypothetical protein
MSKPIKILGALIIILAFIFLLANYINDLIGTKDTQVKDIVQNTNEKKVLSDIAQDSPLAATSDEDFTYLFTALPKDTSSGNVYGNIVGYFDYGTLVTYIPDWLADHWTTKSDKGDPSSVTISPKEKIDDKDFSNIDMTFEKTDETFNASFLYQQMKDDQNYQNVVAETILNNAGDTMIYHIVRKYNTLSTDFYFIDGGNNKTATITFSANSKNYDKYAPKIKEFIQGLGKGKPQG